MKLFFFLLSFLVGTTLVAQEHLEIQLQKGIVFFENGKYAQAERIFDKIIKEEESYAAVYIWKGKCLQIFEEYQAAYEAFCTARNLKPQHAPYWLAVGNFKFDLGSATIQKPEVCGSCGKSFLPNNGEMPKAADFYQSALVDYEKAIQLDSNYAAAYYQLALVYHNLNESTKACEMLSSAKKLKDPLAEQNPTKICP